MAFWGDSVRPAIDMVSRGEIDYLCCDHLAELTMSILSKQRRANPDLGYTRDVVDLMRGALRTCVDRGIKIVTNAGGANPVACAHRIAEVAKLMANAGQIVIVSAISPLKRHRDLARSIIGADFHEIHVHADLATCESRDPKGLYERARAGKIAEFTGISAPYEIPAQPALAIDTATLPLQDAGSLLINYIEDRLASGPVTT